MFGSLLGKVSAAAQAATSSSSSSSSSSHGSPAAGTSSSHSTAFPDATSHATGRKKALLIGINYIGHEVGRLNGCINDTINIENYLMSEWGYKKESIRRLNDDNPAAMPTKANMLAGMQWLVEGAAAGDTLFMHYSGHGSQTNGSSWSSVVTEEDGKDETICPCDYQTAGMLVDDEMHKIIVKPLPAGVRLTIIFDSCHSGTAMDLPFVYKAPVESEYAAADNNSSGISGILGRHHVDIGAAIKGGAAGIAREVGTIVGKEVAFHGSSYLRQNVNSKLKKSKADVIMISGCQDSQTSADATLGGAPTGAMSFSLLTALRANKNTNYTTLIKSMRDILHHGNQKFSQMPQMSFGREINPDIQVYL